MVHTVPTGHGTEIVEVPPETCPNGHRTARGGAMVGWDSCGCAGTSGHRYYRCKTCGALTNIPPHREDAPIITGRWL